MKDDNLATLSDHQNVAQFVSFSPGNTPQVRHAKVRGEIERALLDSDPRDAIQRLLERSRGSVNVRSFKSDQDKGNPFEYGLTHADSALALVCQLAQQGYYTIVNETIDVHDGGFSGVLMGEMLEFAPDRTPRAVEESGSASLPVSLARRLVETVYGFAPDWPNAVGKRIELSVHPYPVGYRASQGLLWETEDVAWAELQPVVVWPNEFSKLIGDKTYGLLLADLAGLPVPHTLVLPRRVAPFRFGTETGSRAQWVRTAPVTPQPGLYTTTSSYTDVFALMAKEDPDGTAIASVLIQSGVSALYSGAAYPSDSERPYLEGVPGSGDAFMLGEAAHGKIPAAVRDRVSGLHSAASIRFGSVRMEWVDDGVTTWVVQMHNANTPLIPGVFNPGTPENGWRCYDPSEGLDSLRLLVKEASESGQGVEVTAPVGLTSHVGDIIRRAAIPGRLGRVPQRSTGGSV